MTFQFCSHLKGKLVLSIARVLSCFVLLLAILLVVSTRNRQANTVSGGATGGLGNMSPPTFHEEQFSHSSKFDEKVLGGGRVMEPCQGFEMCMATRLRKNFRAWHPESP